MAEHHRERDQQQQQHKGPSTLQILAVATLFPVGGVLLCLAGLTLAGTLVGFAVMTPLFVIFSPVLVPAALTFALAVAGFLTSGAFGITALSALSWIFNYMRQMRGTLSEHLEHAKRRMQDTAGHPSMAEHHRDRDQKQQDTAGHPSMAEHHRDRDKKQQGTAGHPSMAEHHRDRDLKQRHPTDVIKSMLPHKGPSTSQVLAVATLFPVGGGLLCLAGMTLAGTVVGLAVTTPVFVIFSPVLVPAALTFATAVAGFLTSGAFGITALSSFSWIVNYMRQMRGTLQEHLEHAKRRMAGHGG